MMAEQGKGTRSKEEASDSVSAWPSVGRIIHYNIGADEQDWRPAIVVRDDGGTQTVEVFLGPGDIPFSPASRLAIVFGKAFSHISPHLEGEGVGCWRWPPKEG